MADAIIIFITCLFSTFLSALSGGGSSLINFPIFLSMNMSFPMATAVQKISSAVWTPPAAYTYLKNKKIDYKFLIIFGMLGLVGVYLGLKVILNVNEAILKRSVGFLIVGLSVYTLFNKKMGLAEHTVSSKVKSAFAYLMAIVLGAYESLFGAANGIAFAVLTIYAKGYDFIKALGYYFAIAFVWVASAAVFLISKGYYDLHFMIPTALGSVIGGFFGAKFGKYKGNKFIKTVFVSVGVLLGFKLILNI